MTVISLPSRIVRGLRDTVAGTSYEQDVTQILAGADQDTDTGTYRITVPTGRTVLMHRLLHDTGLGMATEEPQHRMRVYQRMFDKAAQRLLAA